MIRKKPLVLRAIRPNVGLRSWYRARLNDILREVRDEVLEEVDKYKHIIPSPVAVDSQPLAERISEMITKWVGKIKFVSEKLAKEFVFKNFTNYDINLKSQLRRADMSVNLQMSEYAKDALQKAVSTNVGLIKSLPTEYLVRVEKAVYSAMHDKGFDLQYLTKELESTYGISRRRAKLIAIDQSNKANSAIEKARRMELGIEEAIWQHSRAAKKPRASHLRADGKVFKVAKGCYIDGKYIQAGEEINCGCVSRSIIRY